MPSAERWSASLWPFVAASLPAAPARVIEVGCGPLGGFVPLLRASGYDAIGVDRKAPAGDDFRQSDFEELEIAEPVDAIVASRSLHHVGDLARVIAHAASAIRPGGTIVVAEWAWESLDEQTALWCFARLGEIDPGEHNWLDRRRGGWAESGRPWDAYFAEWATGHGLQRSDHVVDELDRRFDRRAFERGPYFFAERLEISEASEQAAIDAGEARATGIRYAGVLR